MKKIILFILALLICFSGVSAFADNASVTYGADNLNNKSGDLIVGFLGGSITEGSGASKIQNRWTTRVVNEYFKVNYPNKNVIEKNAAIGGTGSEYGMQRVRKDLGLDTDTAPDVVFVEFAVNDAYEKGMSLSQKTESIVRQLLSFKKIPVIIFIYTTSVDSVNKNGNRDGKAVENAIDAQSAVAERYGIYGINLNDYIWAGVKEGRFIWERGQAGTLTGDGTHPNDSGYEVYADRIVEMLTKDKAKAFKKLDPDTEPYGDYVFGEIEEIPLKSDGVKLGGDWSKKSYRPIDMTENMGNYPERFFRDGYMHSDDGTKATIEYEFTGRGIGIDYLRTKNNAKLEYTVYDESGKAVKTGTTAMYYKTDTGRCCGQTLVSGLPYGKYKFVAKGVLNTAAVDDNAKNPNEGGSGLELNIAYLVVDKAMPRVAPHADNVKITTAVVGANITASYDYSCKMYKESGSDIGFYISDSENGTYTKVSDKTSYILKNEDLGKYIKFSVIPKNENGDVGKSSETAPVRINRPTGKIGFKTPVAVKVDGKDAEKPGIGQNTFSGTLINVGEQSATVQILAATYKKNGDYKILTGTRIISKTLAAGESAEFAIDITAAESDSEIHLTTFSSDSMEPVNSELKNMQYIGVTDDGGVSTSVYEINYFN